jgi:hypothetical protein
MESRIKDLHDKWFKGLHARPELNNDKKYNRLFYIIKVLQACESDLVITDNHDYKTPYMLVMDFIEYNLDLMKDGNNPVSDFEIDNIYKNTYKLENSFIFNDTIVDDMNSIMGWIKENWHDAKNYKLHKLENINIKDIRKKLAKEFINDIKYDFDNFRYIQISNREIHQGIIRLFDITDLLLIIDSDFSDDVKPGMRHAYNEVLKFIDYNIDRIIKGEMPCCDMKYKHIGNNLHQIASNMLFNNYILNDLESIKEFVQGIGGLNPEDLAFVQRD